jgi:hypothetical protein
VIDPVSSSSITQQTKKRPLEDDTATTGAYLQLVLHICFLIFCLFIYFFCFIYTKKKLYEHTKLIEPQYILILSE